MKSAVLHKYRSALSIEDMQVRKITINEVRIKTAYAGVSFTDRIIQQGLYRYQREHMPIPYTPGFEASGTIIEKGKEVAGLAVGDSVVVLQRSGCFSSEIFAQSENVIKIPDGTDLAWAASLPVNFFTASHALRNIVKIFPNSKLLVTSAAGGVGGMLTQLASTDHQITGLVGLQQKKEYVRKLGAHKVSTYEEFHKQKETFDVVFVASGSSLEKYYKKLNPNGKIIMYGFHEMVPSNFKSVVGSLYSYLKLPTFKPIDLVYKNKTVSGFNIIHLEPSGKEFQSNVKHFLRLLDTDSIPKVHNIQEYKLTDINKAMTDLAGGNTEGKILIKF